MLSRSTLSSLLVGMLACASGACEPELSEEGGGLGELDAAVPDAGAGLAPRPRGFVVVSSDYSVASIGLLDPSGAVKTRELVHSGSTRAGLVTALSGDVLLPTRSDDSGVLVLIDRFRTDVITRIDLASGAVLGQVKTHAPNSQSSDSFTSNPYDYVYLDEDSAWITRYEPNPTAPSGDRGTDLLRIDPTDFTRGDERIDFSKWHGEATRANPDTGATDTITVYARPAGLLRLGDYLVVGIETLSLGFDAAGKGLVALVDPTEARVVQMLELEGMTSCGSVAPVPDDEERVGVGCTGFYREDPRSGAGLVMLRLQGEKLVVEHVWRASDDPSAPLSMYGATPLSATQVLATAAGDAEGTSDTLYLVDLESGEQREVFTAESAYVLGHAQYEPRSRMILLPDASTDDKGKPTGGIRRFSVHEDGEIEALGTTRVHEILPPRSVRALY